MHFELIASGAAAGVIAALAATGILELAKFIRRWRARRQDEKYINSLLNEGNKRVMAAKDTFNEGMGATISGDELRAAQYNNMVRQLDVAIDRRAVHLSHEQRQAVLDALDWYHTTGLHAIKKLGGVEFVDLPEGRWPTTTMSAEIAIEKFKALESIKWLKLNE